MISLMLRCISLFHSELNYFSSIRIVARLIPIMLWKVYAPESKIASLLIYRKATLIIMLTFYETKTVTVHLSFSYQSLV